MCDTNFNRPATDTNSFTHKRVKYSEDCVLSPVSYCEKMLLQPEELLLYALIKISSNNDDFNLQKALLRNLYIYLEQYTTFMGLILLAMIYEIISTDL